MVGGRNILKSPLDRYEQDPQYRALVDTIEGLLHKCQFSPAEVREAAVMACIRYEMRTGFRHLAAPRGVNEAFRVLHEWTKERDEEKRNKDKGAL